MTSVKKRILLNYYYAPKKESEKNSNLDSLTILKKAQDFYVRTFQRSLGRVFDSLQPAVKMFLYIISGTPGMVD